MTYIFYYKYTSICICYINNKYLPITCYLYYSHIVYKFISKMLIIILYNSQIFRDHILSLMREIKLSLPSKHLIIVKISRIIFFSAGYISRIL